MTALFVLMFTMVAISATVVVLTREPQRQAVSLGVFGVLLTVLFLVLQTPDVALSELGIGAAVVPLMVMLAIRKIRGGR